MKLHWKPSEFAFLSPKERALMYAFIDERVKSEDAQTKKLNSMKPSRSRRRR